MKRALSMLLVQAPLFVSVALAQPQLHQLDLGTVAAGSVIELPVRAGTSHEFKIVNKLPGVGYTVTVSRELVPIAVLADIFGSAVPEPSGAAPARQTPCQALLDPLKAGLKGAKKESEVDAAIKSALSDIAYASCTAPERQVFTTLIESSTHYFVDSIDVGRGEQIEVAVSRGSETWTWTFSTGSRGEWRVMYGFTLIPNEDESFFAKRDAGTSEFIVTREADRKELDFAPSIFFHFHDGGADAWSNGFTAGLGSELEDDPILFGGWGWTYHQNLMLTLGIVAHKQQRLAGRLTEGQTISEDLALGQLGEDTYQANAYFGIAFRFGSNVHQQRQEAVQKAAKARADAAKAKADAENLASKKAEVKAGCLELAAKKEASAKAVCAVGPSVQRTTCDAAAEVSLAEAQLKCREDA